MLWFAILQVLDLATTLVGFRVGATEASPFVRLLMGLGPATGVAVSKAVAILLAVVCIRSGHGRVVHWVNFWYAGLFFWNAFVIAAIAWRNGGF